MNFFTNCCPKGHKAWTILFAKTDSFAICLKECHLLKLCDCMKNCAAFYHLIAFWLGTQFIVAGFIFHLPDFIAAKKMHFCMYCMPMSKLMLTGMGLILI